MMDGEGPRETRLEALLASWVEAPNAYAHSKWANALIAATCVYGEGASILEAPGRIEEVLTSFAGTTVHSAEELADQKRLAVIHFRAFLKHVGPPSPANRRRAHDATSAVLDAALMRHENQLRDSEVVSLVVLAVVVLFTAWRFSVRVSLWVAVPGFLVFALAYYLKRALLFSLRLRREPPAACAPRDSDGKTGP